MLTLPFIFETIDSDATLGKKSQRLRDSAAAAHETTTYTATQRVFNLMSFKQRRETAQTKLAVKQLQQLYNEGMADVPGQEALAEAWVDAACTVWERVLLDEQLRTLVLDMDNTYGQRSPFNSVYKLNEVVKIARTREAIAWCLLSLVDLITANAITADDCAVRLLTGKGLGGKGILHTLLFKKDAMVYLWDYVRGQRGFSDSFKSDFMNKYDTPEKFRLHFGYDGDETDLTWITAMKESEQLVVKLFEALLGSVLPPPPPWGGTRRKRIVKPSVMTSVSLKKVRKAWLASLL